MIFITKSKKYSQQLYQWLLILLIAGVFLQAYNQSRLNTQKSAPYIVNYAQGVSIAISELKYGSEQSTGYVKIYNLFIPLFKWGVDWGPEFSSVNRVIKEALELDDVSAEGQHSTNYEGLNSYYKLAFTIFGYQAESAFYLYWLILAISVLIFLVTFYQRPVLLFYLLLFICALFAISQTQALLLESIIRNRFFSLLTILPSFYLALLISDHNKVGWVAIIGGFSQALILAILAYIRPSSLYQILFLMAVTVIFVILKQLKSRFSKLTFTFNPKFWPLAFVIVGYILVRLFTLNPVFVNTLTNRSCTWHMYYMGLASHPTASEKYGIVRDDSVVYELVARKAPEWGYNYNLNATSSLTNLPAIMTTLMAGLPPDPDLEIGTCGEAYETIVKHEFVNILKQDPWFVIGSYFFKIPQYLQVYFGPLDRDVLNAVYANPANPGVHLNYRAFGVIDQLLDWPVVLSLILGIFIIRNVFLKKWLLPLVFLVLQFLFAALVPFLYFPINHTIADSALILTIILLALFSRGICYLLHLIERNWSSSQLLKLGYIISMVLLSVLILRGVVGYQPFKPKIAEAFTSETQFYGQSIGQVLKDYEGFNIILYKGTYYALAELGQVDVTNRMVMQDCQGRGQCFWGDSLETVKLQASSPRLVLKDYHDSDIFSYDYKFYVLSRSLGELYQDLDPMVLVDEQFLKECQAHGQCAIGNTLEEAKQLTELLPKLVLENYQGFDLVSYNYKYYVLHRDLGVLDEGIDPVIFANEQFLQECEAHGQCAVGNSLEEGKQLLDLLTPELAEEDYQGFFIVSYGYKFYALSRTFITLDQRLESTHFLNENFWQTCQAQKQCAIGNSLEEAKQLVDIILKDN